jgi:hypothetical protein
VAVAREERRLFDDERDAPAETAPARRRSGRIRRRAIRLGRDVGPWWIRLELRQRARDLVQGAFEPTKMCADGRSPGSFSMHPAGRKTSPCHASPGVTDPQRVQKGREKPGDDS